MAGKRKSRSKANKKVDITKPLAPIDITKFGTDEDPCFGKLFDLTEDECRRCGDQAICQIVFNQKTEKLRGKEESNSRFKDLELNTIEAENFIRSKKESGKSKKFVTRRTVKKFNLSEPEVKKLVKKIWN
jgi:hypothetical protein